MITREQSLRYSFLDGLFASVMVGLTVNYTIPFALALGANNFQIGLLNSIPQLFGSLVQIKSADFAERRRSRVRFITNFVLLQAFFWLLAGILPPILVHNRIQLFIILITLNTVFVSAIVPVWLSLMSDTVDKARYGEYFAWRGRILGFVTLVSSFIAGFFLFAFAQSQVLAFATLFIIAGISRFLSGYYLSRMADVPITVSPEKRFSYFEFIKRTPESNFVRFSLFVAGINFATFLAAPFFSVYMLKELRFPYSTYTIINTGAAISGLLLLPFWGRYADRYGNVKILKTCAFFLPLIPILWIFSSSVPYLIIINVFAGYIWAGFNLCAVNFIFDAASPEVRTRCLGYFNFTNGLAIFFGALAGGFLASRLPIIFSGGSRLLTLFLISGIIRLLVNALQLRSFKEVRSADKIENHKLLSVILGIKPILSLGEELFFRLKR